MFGRTFVSVTAAVVAAVPGLVSSAAAVQHSASAPSAASVASAPRIGPARAVTLVTGERVTPRTVVGKTTYAVSRARTSGPGSAMSSFTVRGRTYLVPAVATAYLGKVLDPSLFDVTTLSATADPSTVQLRIAHTGATPHLPGITITADRAGVAQGVVTAASAPAFGAAVAAAWQADHGTGASTLFAGVTSIAAVAVAPPVVNPSFPMHTLIIKAVDADGAPTDAFGLLMNVDDGAKYVGFVNIIGGEARVSVPAGTYAGGVFASDLAADGTFNSRLVVASGYQVTGGGQVLTFDSRLATTRVSATLPRATPFLVVGASWSQDDAVGQSSLGLGTEALSPDALWVTPTAASQVGTQHYAATVTAFQRDPGGPTPSAYSYDLFFPADRIPAVQRYLPAAGDMMVVRAAYDADREGRPAGMGRYVADPSLFWISFWPLTTPTTRTEYVLGPAGSQWYESSLADAFADDPGFVDGGPYPFQAGTSSAHTWRRGPLGAGIPKTPSSDDYAFCWACRTPTDISVGMSPAIDSQPDHSYEMFGSPDGTPVTHLRLTRDGVVLADADDYLGAYATVPKAKGRYTLSLDVDRYWTGTTLSGRSHTEVSFTSGANAGPLAPPSWGCDGCRVLPVLQAKAVYPVSQTGVVSAGAQVFEVKAARIQGATQSKVVSATLSLRPAGWGWADFPLTRDSSGRFRTSIDLPDFLVGSAVDVRLQASDAGGSTFDQTVSRAFLLGAGTALAVGAARAGAAGAAASAAVAGPSAFGPFAKPILHASCATPTAGSVRCLSQWRSGAGAGALARVNGSTRDAVGTPADGYGPADIASAYQLTTATAGQTVAIVDAYDNPNVEADLAAYRSAFGLPACTTANGCFRKLNQRGGSAPPDADPGWGVEISLDVQAVSAACPTCKILLVEADSASLDDIGLAVNRAVARGAKIVSNSYGTDEFTGMFDFANAYYTHPGVAQVVSSGDWGFTAAAFPAVLGNAIAVGGTSLTHDAGGWQEQAWWGAGSGCSAWVAKPAWQHDRHCSMRTTSDLSAVADPDTGFAVYDTFGLGPDSGWIVVGGTSLSAPLIAGMIGRAGNPAKLATARYAYAHRSALQDVVGGSNGYCGGDYLCTGKKGYDGPTGLGSPRGLGAL